MRFFLLAGVPGPIGWPRAWRLFDAEIVPGHGFTVEPNLPPEASR